MENCIRVARRRKHYTLEELAELVGVSRRMISRYENGQFNAGTIINDRLIEVLEIPRDDLDKLRAAYLNRNA